MGKAVKFPAIRKGEDAKEHDFRSMSGTTIPFCTEFSVQVKCWLRLPGTGVIPGAGKVFRASGNEHFKKPWFFIPNMVNATMEGLKSLKTLEEVAKVRGKQVEELKA